MSKISISLGNKVGVWFLGDPKQLKVFLSVEQPGPLEINTEDYTLQEQMHIVLSVGNGSIVTETPYDLLANEYNQKLVPQVAPTPIESPKPEEKKKRYVPSEYEKLHKNCKKVLAQGVRAVKSFVITNENIKILQILKGLESQGKKRASLLSFLEERLKSYEDKISKTLSKGLGTDTVPPPRGKLEPEVEESDFEEIAFSITQIGEVTEEIDPT
jgi:hypothetical protein